MRYVMPLILNFIFGCTTDFVEEAEKDNLFKETQSIENFPSMCVSNPCRSLREDAERLGRAYMDQASAAATQQRRVSSGTIGLASITVVGIATSAAAAPTALAAAGGYGLDQFNRKTASESQIKNLYAGSRRMYCIGSALEIYGEEVNLAPELAVPSAKMAIRDASIMTRTGNVTAPIDFKQVVEEVAGAIPSFAQEPVEDQPVSIAPFLSALSSCLNSAPSEPS